MTSAPGLAIPIIPPIVDELAVEGFPPDALGELDPTDVVIDKTACSQIVGRMKDLAFICDHAAGQAAGFGGPGSDHSSPRPAAQHCLHP